MGCNGGWPSAAWQWFVSTGVVTGGNYGNFSGCLAYSFPNCEHHSTGPYPQCSTMSFSTPACAKKCDAESKITVPYPSDKFHFKNAYSLSGEESIKQDIYDHGSVEVAFSVYEDFLTYKVGVYHHVTGSYLGGHAVKVIGWGVQPESGTPYWIVVNSWNETWGDKGYFLIKRGNNECGVEGGATAGLPVV